MKTISTWITGIALIATVGNGNQLAASSGSESPVSVSVDVGFASQDLWRGFVLNDTPSMQPGLAVGYKGLTLSTWSNLSHRGPAGQVWTEHDFTLDYSRDFGDWTTSVGYINYAFPDLNEGKYTNELYFGLSRGGLLNPSFTIYRDVDEGDGWYYYASVGHSFSVPGGMSVNPSVGMGVNQHLFQTQTAVSNLDVGVSVDIPVSGVVFSPFFTQMVGHRTLFGNHNVFGVTMSISR